MVCGLTMVSLRISPSSFMKEEYWVDTSEVWRDLGKAWVCWGLLGDAEDVLRTPLMNCLKV